MKIAFLALIGVIASGCSWAPEGSAAWMMGNSGQRVSVNGAEFKVVPYKHTNTYAAIASSPSGSAVTRKANGIEAVERVTGCKAIDATASATSTIVDVVVGC